MIVTGFDCHDVVTKKRCRLQESTGRERKYRRRACLAGATIWLSNEQACCRVLAQLEWGDVRCQDRWMDSSVSRGELLNLIQSNKSGLII